MSAYGSRAHDYVTRIHKGTSINNWIHDRFFARKIGMDKIKMLRYSIYNLKRKFYIEGNVLWKIDKINAKHK